MAKRNAATVQTPGATTAPTDEQTAKPAGPSVAEAAKTKRAKGPVDPLTLKQPVFTDAGWVCPAKADQITVVEDDEDADDESDED